MSARDGNSWSYADDDGRTCPVEIVRFEGAKTRVRLPDGTEITVDTNRLSRFGKRRTR